MLLTLCAIICIQNGSINMLTKAENSVDCMQHPQNIPKSTKGINRDLKAVMMQSVCGYMQRPWVFLASRLFGESYYSDSRAAGWQTGNMMYLMCAWFLGEDVPNKRLLHLFLFDQILP